jgi:hypothetical protein
MKRNVIFILFFVLVMGGALWAGENATLKVKVATANVRSEPDASAAIIAKVTMGTVLEALGKEGAWYEVNVKDETGEEVTGYIHKTVVDVSGEVEEEAEAEPREAPKARAVKSFARGGFKLMGGLSLGNGTFSETLPTSYEKRDRKNFMGGIGYESGGMIAFSIETIYSPGGAIIHAENPSDPSQWADITLAANAISLPLMLKVRFLRGDMTPYIMAGGEVGYILDAKLKLETWEGDTDEQDILDEVNRLFYGISAGAGFEMRLGGMNLLLEGRYRLALSNLIKDADPGDYIKPTAIMFLLGIRF